MILFRGGSFIIKHKNLEEKASEQYEDCVNRQGIMKFEYTNRMIKQTIEQINFKDNKTLIFSIQHQVIFKSAFKIFKDNTYFGIGPKNFREVCKNKKYQTIVCISTNKKSSNIN